MLFYTSTIYGFIKLHCLAKWMDTPNHKCTLKLKTSFVENSLEMGKPPNNDAQNLCQGVQGTLIFKRKITPYDIKICFLVILTLINFMCHA